MCTNLLDDDLVIQDLVCTPYPADTPITEDGEELGHCKCLLPIVQLLEHVINDVFMVGALQRVLEDVLDPNIARLEDEGAAAGDVVKEDRWMIGT